MKAYFRARLGHPHCLYLDGQEAEQVERELDRLDLEDFPALAKVERYLNRVTGAAREGA